MPPQSSDARCCKVNSSPLPRRDAATMPHTNRFGPVGLADTGWAQWAFSLIPARTIALGFLTLPARPDPGSLYLLPRIRERDAQRQQFRLVERQAVSSDARLSSLARVWAWAWQPFASSVFLAQPWLPCGPFRVWLSFLFSVLLGFVLSMPSYV